MHDKKPGLMIAVLEGLKKKGKMGEAPEKEADDSDSYRDHLLAISKDLIKAVHDEDPEAVADLLEEAFQCMELAPHEEGPHLEEGEDKYWAKL